MARIFLGLAVDRVGGRVEAKSLYTGPSAEAAIEACREAVNNGEVEAWLIRDPKPLKRYRKSTQFPAPKPAPTTTKKRIYHA